MNQKNHVRAPRQAQINTRRPGAIPGGSSRSLGDSKADPDKMGARPKNAARNLANASHGEAGTTRRGGKTGSSKDTRQKGSAVRIRDCKNGQAEITFHGPEGEALRQKLSRGACRNGWTMGEYMAALLWHDKAHKEPEPTAKELAMHRKLTLRKRRMDDYVEREIRAKDGTKPLTLRLSRKAWRKLSAQSLKQDGMACPDYAALTLEYALLTGSEPPKKTDPLSLSPKHSRFFRMAAGLLNVEPSEWLRWMMNDLERDMRTGLLGNWAADLIEYDSPETAGEVQTRVNAWLAKQKKGGRSK